MIAVTGANGLLGSFVAKQLHGEAIPFVAIKRESSDASLVGNLPIAWRESDILDMTGLCQALRGVDTVIHAAALVSFNPRDREKLYQVNVEGTRNVVNACLEAGVKRLLHVSSVAALGRKKGTFEVNEESRWQDSAFNSDYAETKYLAELEVYRGQEEGLQIDIINPSIILAPANWHNSSAQLFKYAWEEKPFYTDGLLNYVDVRDVSRVIMKLLAHGQGNGERIIVNGGAVSSGELLAKIAQRLGKRPPPIKVSHGLLFVLAWFESIRAWLTAKQPLVSTQSVRAAQDKFCFSNKKAMDQLKMKFILLDETLDWCCSYYRQKNDSAGADAAG